MERYTRRECLGALASAAVVSVAGSRVIGAVKVLRGAFMILHTPFTDSKEVDWEDLAREAVFVDRCGAQGIVWPQGTSSVTSLSKDERMRGMEVLAGAVKGRQVALILGVQGKDIPEMLEYARRAEALAPDAVIAMPPTAAQSEADYREYFRALGKATSRPVFLQTSGGARNIIPSTELIVELAKEMPNFGYVKEESDPVVERMKALVRQRPPMRGVFGASFGVGWLYEMRLGLDGVITGNAMYADVMAAMWDLHQKKRNDQLRDAFSKWLIMRNLNDQIPGADLYVMKKRGIFKTIATRGRTEYTFSADEVAEIDYRFAGLAPYLKRGA
jgi:dihydrodipicolinate synthase/N-acetylneuraminate lyase